jgi:hypothetical protein
MTASNWLLFIANLPGRNQTLRMRVWRSLKASGAGALRDGVYALPASDAARAEFERQSREIQEGGGTAYILELARGVAGAEDDALVALFDRSTDYGEFITQLAAFRRKLIKLDEATARRSLEGLRRRLGQIVGSDFFPGASRRQAEGALIDAEAAMMARFSPGEPHSMHRAIRRRNRSDYRGRIWATREHLWIDRVCCAWLIRRFIDAKAKFLWLKQLKDRPSKALGFDFDGAEFSHVDDKVTFEVLITSFGLEQDSSLTRLAALVHFLDVGGVPVPEAAGLAAIVTGARIQQPDDDALLRVVAPLLDSLYAAYSVPERL